MARARLVAALSLVVLGFAAGCGGEAQSGNHPDSSVGTGGRGGDGGAVSGAGGAGTGGVSGTGGASGSGGRAGAGGGGAGTGGDTGTGGRAGAGGSPGTGGTVGAGGSAGTGGRAGTGGSVGTGGSAGTGGRAGTGGSPGTGGNVGTGGRTGTGGSVGTGGSPGTGGAGTGGSPGTGGTPGTGGAPFVNPFNSTVTVLEPSAHDNDFFGSSVAVHKDVIAIVAQQYGVGQQASTLVYRFGPNGWRNEGTLILPLGNCGSPTCHLTQTVSVHDDVLAIGVVDSLYKGYAVVYRHSASGWTLEATLQRPDREVCAPGPLMSYDCQQELGSDISVFGDRLLVGAPRADVQPASPNPVVTAGVAYMYRFDGTSWVVEQMLTAPSPVASGFFGDAVSIYEDRALIGEPANGTPGRVHIYHRSGTTWTLEATLTTCDQTVNTAFGASASLGPDAAVVGAVNATVGGKAYAGAAYVFRRHGTDWIQEAKLTAPDFGLDNAFGASVAITDKYVLIGAPGAPEIRGASGPQGADAGQLYLFEHDPTRTPSWNAIRVAQGMFGPKPSPSELGTSVAMWSNVAVAGLPTNCCTSATDNNGSVLILTACRPGVSSCDGPLCTVGAAVCDGDRATTCAADGMSYDTAGTDCSAAGGTCSAGACVTPACVAGQGTCDGAAMGMCRDDGLGTLDLGMCGGGQVCDPGLRACGTPSCHP